MSKKATLTGSELKKLREAAGLTQQELADLARIKTYATILGYESGKPFPLSRQVHLRAILEGGEK
jgi:transcriptional regulator with XRE-family HTH domain